MPLSYQPFDALRLTRAIQALQDVRELPAQLTFLARTPVVPAVDGEIMARFIGRATIADIVADDARAVTYNNLKVSFETTTVPNIKHGRLLTQEMLNLLNSIQAGGGPGDAALFESYQMRTIDDLLLGIRQRMEALVVAMAIDSVVYNRFGIQINGSWGMPSDLKVTPSIPWTDSANSTPVTNTLLLLRVGRVRYGAYYDRMTMSLSAFDYMTKSAEFIARAGFVLRPGESSAAIPLQNTDYMINLAKSVLGVKEIELYDARYWTQAADGTLASAPFLPINQVVFSSMSDDGDPTATDFAMGTVTETLVADWAPTNVIGRFGGAQRGPVAYATASGDLNPPNVTEWGVARGFPRKHRLQSTAVMTVGTFTDDIPVGLPF